MSACSSNDSTTHNQAGNHREGNYGRVERSGTRASQSPLAAAALRRVVRLLTVLAGTSWASVPAVSAAAASPSLPAAADRRRATLGDLGGMLGGAGVAAAAGAAHTAAPGSGMPVTCNTAKSGKGRGSAATPQKCRTRQAPTWGLKKTIQAAGWSGMVAWPAGHAVHWRNRRLKAQR